MSAPGLKILVADDVAANVAVVRAVAEQHGHTVVTAADGREAVEVYRRERPDLVFMDVIMPRMDGLAAVREIRSLPAERWVPVVFLSALDRMDDVLNGLEGGGDDYLTKPVDLRLLRAKINAFAKAIALQRELFDYAEALARWQTRQRSENELARHVLTQLTGVQTRSDPLVRVYCRPADHFSGDLICVARTPADVLHILVADASGHGLAAALCAMTLPPVFYEMTAKGFSLAAIATELNRKLKRLLPADRFVAATLAAVDVRGQTVEVWNGGNPSALYISPDGEPRRWPSRHMPLGILSPEAFSDATEITRIKGGGHLLLCTDGLLELESAAGEPLGQAGVERLLVQTPPMARFQRLQDSLESLLAEGAGAQDDISFALVEVPRERRQQRRIQPVAPTGAPVSDWRLELAYGPAELRELDVVPMVLGILSQIKALQEHQGALFLIISELYNNALDHGLLGLDSAIKEQEGGFERYLGERAARLRALDAGRIELGFHLSADDGHTVLELYVKDSGPGFDYAAYLTPATAADRRAHGRGIALVRSLCQELVYNGCGNEARAKYVF